jgi:hypothetical protein
MILADGRQEVWKSGGLEVRKSAAQDAAASVLKAGNSRTRREFLERK